MSLDKIIVFSLALIFFGGIAYLIRKNRRDGGAINPSAEAVEKQANGPVSIPRKGKKSSNI